MHPPEEKTANHSEFSLTQFTTHINMVMINGFVIFFFVFEFHPLIQRA